MKAAQVLGKWALSILWSFGSSERISSQSCFHQEETTVGIAVQWAQSVGTDPGWIKDCFPWWNSSGLQNTAALPGVHVILCQPFWHPELRSPSHLLPLFLIFKLHSVAVVSQSEHSFPSRGVVVTSGAVILNSSSLGKWWLDCREVEKAEGLLEELILALAKLFNRNCL